MKMLAYHNDPSIKAKYLARVREHREADQLVKGQYWSGGKGCAVGCTIHGREHRCYETELGIPQVLAHIEDVLFEVLPNGQAMVWPEKFLSAIEPGADLSRIGDRFLHWSLTDEVDGMIRFAKTDQQRAVITRVGKLYEYKIQRKKIKPNDWKTVRREVADAVARGDVAYAVAYAVAYDDAAYVAAHAKAPVRQAEKLIELLRTAV